MQRAVILLLLTAPLFAQEPKWSTSVTLIVSADDPILKADIISYVSREFRSLGDVSVKEGDAEYTIHIIVFSLENMAQLPFGFAFGITVTHKFDMAPLYAFPEEIAALKYLYEGIQVYDTSFLHVGGPHDRRKISEAIVTSIDRSVFQRRRKALQ